MDSVIEHQDATTNDMELIISVLIKYPQINKVDISPELGTLAFTFLVECNLSQKQANEFADKLEKSLELFNKLADLAVEDLEVKFKDYEKLTKIKIIAELFNLTKEKLSFFIDFVSDQFGSDLLQDDFQVSQEKLKECEESIKNNLLNLKETDPPAALVGFRDEGKVLVFDKFN